MGGAGIGVDHGEAINETVLTWDENQAKMFRSMCRHVQQALTKAILPGGNSSYPTWLSKLQLEDLDPSLDDVRLDSPEPTSRHNRYLHRHGVKEEEVDDSTVIADLLHKVEEESVVDALKGELRKERAADKSWTYEFSMEQLTLVRTSTRKKDRQSSRASGYRHQRTGPGRFSVGSVS